MRDDRLGNMDLMRKYGANLWRLHNFQQEAMLRAYADAVEQTREATYEMNRTRQAEQTDAGQKLAGLERKWTELISSGLQLEVAKMTAEHEIAALRLRKQELGAAIDKMDQEEA